MGNGHWASLQAGAPAPRRNAVQGGLAARSTAPPIPATSTAASMTIRLLMIARVTLLPRPRRARPRSVASARCRSRSPPARLLLRRIHRHCRYEAVAIRHRDLRQALGVHHVGLPDDAVAIQ